MALIWPHLIAQPPASASRFLAGGSAVACEALLLYVEPIGLLPTDLKVLKDGNAHQ
jgi:hypothetical protein